MKQTDYCKAIDDLEFSHNLADNVRKQGRSASSFRLLRTVALASVLVCFMISTVFGAVSFLQRQSAKIVPVGTDAAELDDGNYMEFSVVTGIEDVKIHYMELNPKQQYAFRHGMLWNHELGYQRITEDYLLEPVAMNRADLTLEKGDRVYALSIDYLETEKGIISNHTSVYHKDENGEILLNATDGRNGQWPVYFHVESGTIRDALPDWSAADFEGRVGYGYSLMGGILISVIEKDGQTDERSILYWIAPGADTAKIIELPGKGTTHIEQDTVFYQNEAGQLYRMDADFQFELICEYKTMDSLQDGLLTVSVKGKLGILDAYTGELYVFDDIKAFAWDTMDYHALRYGSEGTIALARTQWLHDPERRVLLSLGILNNENGELRLLEIQHDWDGYQHSWLDETRFAVVYQTGIRKVVCVYEFDK